MRKQKEKKRELEDDNLDYVIEEVTRASDYKDNEGRYRSKAEEE